MQEIEEQSSRTKGCVVTRAPPNASQYSGGTLETDVKNMKARKNVYLKRLHIKNSSICANIYQQNL